MEDEEDFLAPAPLFFAGDDLDDEVLFDEDERFAVDVFFFAAEDFPDDANVIPPG